MDKRIDAKQGTGFAVFKLAPELRIRCLLRNQNNEISKFLKYKKVTKDNIYIYNYRTPGEKRVWQIFLQ